MLIRFKSFLARYLHRAGFSANVLTFLSLAASLASGFCVLQEQWVWAGGFVLLAGLLDLLDGEVARLSGSAKKKFGGILDSTMDRYGDGLVLGAILLYFAGEGDVLYAGLALSAMLGSFSIPYVRARAECEFGDCRVGFWERGERIVFVGVALVLSNLPAALWVLGIGTHATAWARLKRSRNLSIAAPAGPDAMRDASSSARSEPAYWAKCAALVFVLLFWRPG